MVRDQRDFTVAKCDLCDGNPQCVAFCPTAAIEYINADTASITPRL
jgi:Fe-S-cluster-containing hydrogenase component 2